MISFLKREGVPLLFLLSLSAAVAEPLTPTTTSPLELISPEAVPPASVPSETPVRYVSDQQSTATGTAKPAVTSHAAAQTTAPRFADGNTSSLVRSHHELPLSSGVLSYMATAGYMPLKTEQGEEQAKIFYTFYAMGNKAEGQTTRPLVFLFNGGPGSSSIWLHMGSYGPKRAHLNDDGTLPPPPYVLVPNEETLLKDADLVFVDPVGSGFSRPSKPELGKNYWGVKQDLNALSEFIRLFLIQNGRMRSPLFLAGESYGTFRVAGLSKHLLDKNIALNGIILISTILDFRPSNPTKGNELPYALYVPTYTAAAWYHKLLPPDLQAKGLKEALAESETWATTSYTLALMKGDTLAGAERDAVVKGLQRYTAMSPEFIENNNLRIEHWRYRKELLRSKKRSLSVYDARLLAIEPQAAGEAPEFDPILGAMGAPYTMLFNDYVRRELGFETDLEYVTLSGQAHGAWDYGDPRSSELMDMSDALRNATARNTAMRTLVARGIYDFATPYFAAEYTFNRLGLDPEVRNNVVTEDYEGGHMMYIYPDQRRKLTEDTARFIRESIPQR